MTNEDVVKNRLSIVAVTRDDKFGDDAPTRYHLEQKLNNDERIKITIESLLSQLEKRGIDAEYVLVDFAPLNEEYLYSNEVLKSTLSHPKVKNVIVHPSACEKMGLVPGEYYEYFAKNVGLRNTTGDVILVTNPDNFFDNSLMDDIAQVVKNNIATATNDEGNSFYFRPYARKDVTYFADQHSAQHMLEFLYGQSRKQDLPWHNSVPFDDRCEKSPDENGFLVSHAMGVTFGTGQDPSKGDIVGTGASGDFTMASRRLFFEVADGYDESSEVRYRPRSMSHMDSEVILKFYNDGNPPMQLSGAVLSLDHAKPAFTGPCNQGVYKNVPGWGMINYASKVVNENTIMIIGD